MQPSQVVMLKAEAAGVVRFDTLRGMDDGELPGGFLEYLQDESRSWRARQEIVEAVVEAIEACDFEIRRRK